MHVRQRAAQRPTQRASHRPTRLCRQRERGYAPDGLTLEPERLTTGGKDHQVSPGAQKPGYNIADRAQQVLTVV